MQVDPEQYYWAPFSTGIVFTYKTPSSTWRIGIQRGPLLPFGFAAPGKGSMLFRNIVGILMMIFMLVFDVIC